LYREPILKKYEPRLDNILYILHDLQNNNTRHYVAREDIRSCAEYLGMPYSYVHGVATFYTMFSLEPRDYLRERLNVGVGETTDDGLFTLELTSCLGICGVAPAVMINDEMFGKLTPEKIDTILGERRTNP
jgi:NADH-quinone oxidoreductase subunit E